MKLTVKELKFIEAYVRTGNRTEAVIEAGYKVGNRQRASEIGYQLLQKTPVSEAITLRLTEAVMSPEEVKSRLSDIGRASLADFTEVSSLDDLKDHPKAHVVKKLKVTRQLNLKTETEYITTEFELHDSRATLVDLGKLHGLFKDTTTNLNIDLSQLSNEQLERIANGEDPLNVLADQGEGGT